MLKKVTSVLLCLIIILILPLQASAATVCYTNFYSADYSSDPGQYMVNIAKAQLGRGEYDLGYNGTAWCAYFVIDCARIAGQTSAIPEGYGRCDLLWNAVEKAGGREVFSGELKAGDLIFYDCSKCDSNGDGVSLEHVGIVSDETYSYEGNVSNKVGEQSSFTDSKKHSTSDGTVKRRYLRPNYQGAIEAPADCYIEANLQSIGVGDTVSFEYNILGATTKSIGIDKDGKRYTSISVSKDLGTANYTFYESGVYCCIIEGSNSLGYSCSQGVYVTVVESKPEQHYISSNITSVGVGDTVSFEYNILGATTKSIGIDKDGKRYTSISVSKDSGTANYTFYESGVYCCIIEGYNGAGYKCSEGVYITVVESEPVQLSVSANKLLVGVGDTVNFEYNIIGATTKCIGIDKDNTRYTSVSVDADFGQTSYTFIEAGTYCCVIEGYNNIGYNCSNGIYITVVDSVPDYSEISIVGGNKKAYAVGDTITFNLNTKNESSKYIGIHKNKEFYYGTYLSEYQYSFTFTEPGSYHASFDALNPYGYTRSNDVCFNVYDTFSLENNDLNIDKSNDFIYGVDLFGITQAQLEAQFGNSNLKIAMKDKNRVATGTMLELVDSDNLVYDTLTVVIFGDVNSDGWYDGNDAFLVNLIVNGMLDKDDIGEAVWTAADCNHDGVIDENDVDLLTGAGLLLNNVDQSAAQAELAENAFYIEYMGLIDQSIDVDINDNTNIDDNVGNGLDRSENENNFEIILADIITFLKQFFLFILSLIFN